MSYQITDISNCYHTLEFLLETKANIEKGVDIYIYFFKQPLVGNTWGKLTVVHIQSVNLDNKSFGSHFIWLKTAIKNRLLLTVISSKFSFTD